MSRPQPNGTSATPSGEADSTAKTALAEAQRHAQAALPMNHKRLRQLLLGCLITLCGVIWLTLLRLQSAPAANNLPLYILMSGGLALSLLTWYEWSRKDPPDHQRQPSAGVSATLFLITLGLTLGAGIVAGQGPYSLGMLALPGLLIISAITSPRAVYRATLASVLIFVAAIHLLPALGWANYSPRQWAAPDAGIAALIIGITGVASAVLARELRQHNAQMRQLSAQADILAAQADHASRHDTLTGLPNRNMAMAVGEHLIELAHEEGGTVSAIILARQDLALLNESMGHSAGDDLLRHTAQQLRKVANHQFIARLGGNEFLLLITSTNDGEAIGNQAQEILEAVDQPVLVRGVEVSGSTAAGIAMYPNDAHNFTELLRVAIRARKEAANLSGSNYRFFNDDMQLHSASRVRLMADLRAAIRHQGQDFWMAYQPKIQLATGRLQGLEALLRWNHHRLGNIPPMDFIELAESSGHILELGAWVLHRACHDAAGWQSQALSKASVAVNVSALQFQQSDIAATVRDALQSSGLEPRRLILEVTESLFVANARQLRETIAQLRHMGVRLAIDDFGTGYSNLGYLQNFDIDSIKIDKRFISNVDRDPKNAALVRAIVRMGHALAMEVVAEGVETQAVANMLMRMGCDTGQGYLWSEPVRSEDLRQRWDAIGQASMRPLRQWSATEPSDAAPQRQSWRTDAQSGPLAAQPHSDDTPGAQNIVYLRTGPPP